MSKASTYFKLLLVRVLRFILSLCSKVFNMSKTNKIPEINDPILVKPAVDIADDVKRGRIKARDVIVAYVKRIKEVNPIINALVELNREALRWAEKIDESIQMSSGSELFEGYKVQNMSLLGVPVTVKDSISVFDMLFTGGLYARRTQVASEDAQVILNIRRAGAIPIANSNIGELSMSTDTDNTMVGFTYNPYDLSRTPGAGGGGETALIGSACSVVGIGADIGASVRWPAFCCGIFGHKVTSGVIPTKGLYPEISESISNLFTIGPFCRYARDIIPMIKAMAGDNIKQLPHINKLVDLSKIKIFYMFSDGDPFKTPLEEDMKRVLTSVVEHFKTKFKTECKEVMFEEFAIASEVWLQMFTQGHNFHSEMANGISQEISIPVELFKSVVGLSKHTKRALLFAYFAQSDPKFDRSKVTLIENLIKRFEDTLGANGVFLYPSSSTVAQKRLMTYLDGLNIGYTCVFNILNAPVTQCPLGLNAEGIPLGIQVAANSYNDHMTIAVARELENKFGGWAPPCTINTEIDSLNDSL